MFPLRDDIPSRRFPVVNVWLIVVNVLVFLYQTSLGPAGETLILRYGFIPARFFLAFHHAPLDPERFLPLFSYMFLHGGFVHLLGNMWMLWIFGDNVEDIMGHGRYLAFYLACGLAAVALQAGLAPMAGIPMVGASGAISGVLGAYFLSFPRARILTLLPIFIFFTMVEIPAFFFLAFWFLLQFLQGTMRLGMGYAAAGGVAWWAHVGGFLAGMALLPLAREHRGRRRPRRWSW